MTFKKVSDRQDECKLIYRLYIGYYHLKQLSLI